MRMLLLPPIVFFASALSMLALDRIAPLIRIESPWTWLGLAPLTVGLAVANWHARLFRRVGTNIDTFGEPDQLVRDGLFLRTRNPMYLGFVISLAGLAFILGSISPWALVVGFMLAAHCWYIPVEERAMAAKFGADYEEYRRRIPRWF